MDTNDFKKDWDSLIPIQRRAAEWDEGALLVLAGPGSGKTRVLTCRIARLLDLTREKKFRILGLTFTNKAADEMRARISKYLPGQEDRLFLGTFHRFCAEVLRQHGTHLNIQPNFVIYSSEDDLQAVLNDAVEKARELSDIISERDNKTLRVIQYLKSQLIPPEECAEYFEDEEFVKRITLVYETYEEELLLRNALDFDSLIQRTHQLFSQFPAFAIHYRIVYPYICIDEFQDTNHAQYQLVKALTGKENKNVFVVADDDQIIYQWNGASHTRIKEFKNDYSPQVIQLPMNYRCPPEVVELANNLIRHNFLRDEDKKPLEAFCKSSGKDTVRVMNNYISLEEEVSGVVEDIKKRHSQELGSVVILARNRKLLDVAKRRLDRECIPAVVALRKDEFQSTSLIWLHAILKLANNKKDRKSLEAVCGTFSQFTTIAIDPEEVIARAEARNSSYLLEWEGQIEKRISNEEEKEIAGIIDYDLCEKIDFQNFMRNVLAWFDALERSKARSKDEYADELFYGYEEEKKAWNELMLSIRGSLGKHLSLELFFRSCKCIQKSLLHLQAVFC